MKINRYNFFRNTFAIFEQKTPDDTRKIHYKSKHGSAYIFTEEGVYRYSNHWGRVGNCRWRIENINHKQQIYFWGFARWSDFFLNQEEQHYFYIEKVKDAYFANHKGNAPKQQKHFRTAKETAKIIKKIKEIENSNFLEKYCNKTYLKDFKEQLIQELLNSSENFNTIFNKLKNK